MGSRRRNQRIIFEEIETGLDGIGKVASIADLGIVLRV
jgi:hypothetical protein